MRIRWLVLAAICLLAGCSTSPESQPTAPVVSPSSTTESVNNECDVLLESQFRTVRDVVMGEVPGGGVGYDRGSLWFDAATATWSSSDVMMIADYECADGALAGQLRHLEYTGTVVTDDAGQITVYWDGEWYEPVEDPNE